MRTINVFIAQPMHGKELDDIRKERAQILTEFMDWYHDNIGDSSSAEFVDINSEFYLKDAGDNWPETPGRLFYLGRSIQRMELADFVVFANGYQNADGCCVERTAAAKYFKYEVYNQDANSAFVELFRDGEQICGYLTPSINNIIFGRKY